MPRRVVASGGDYVVSNTGDVLEAAAMAHRIDFRVVVANSTQALSVYDHMRGLAVHAVPLNPGAANAEPAWSRVEELVDGVLVTRRSYVGTEDGAQTPLGAGPFIVLGMAPYPDASHADNALAHAQALAEQGAVVLTGVQMAGFPFPPTHSTGRVHVCGHDAGLPCETGTTFAVPLPEPADGVEWVAGEAVVAGDVRWYQGIAYEALPPGHTTQAGWEPPNVPALWSPV